MLKTHFQILCGILVGFLSSFIIFCEIQMDFGDFWYFGFVFMMSLVRWVLSSYRFCEVRIFFSSSYDPTYFPISQNCFQLTFSIANSFISKQTTQNGENGAEIKISWQNYKIIKAPCKLTSWISIKNKKVKSIVLYYTQGDLISLTTSKKKRRKKKGEILMSLCYWTTKRLAQTVQ